MVERPILIVPGLGGSGPGHWQILWETSLPNARRVTQADWHAPHPGTWIATLASAIENAPGAVVVAHSLGCIVLGHALARSPKLPVMAALLVAPADVERCGDVAASVRDFAPVPRLRLPFPSAVVASTSDPYVSASRAKEFAEAWGAELIDIGPSGHINVESGFGPWSEGKAILERLMATV